MQDLPDSFRKRNTKGGRDKGVSGQAESQEEKAKVGTLESQTISAAPRPLPGLLSLGEASTEAKGLT
jgi:hypothetical protein